MKGTILRVEWRVGFRNKRLLFFNTVVPLAFVGPIVLGGAPGTHATSILVVLFALFATFGSSIPLVRDYESGLLQRFLMTGIDPGRLLLERTAAFVIIDFLQLFPAMLLIVVSTSASPGDGFLFLVTIFLTLVAGNLLGVLAASISRSIAEGALFSSLLALYMVHLSGVFRIVPDESFVRGFEAWMPFRPMYLAIGTLISGVDQWEGGRLMIPSLLLTVLMMIMTYLRGRAFFTGKYQ